VTLPDPGTRGEIALAGNGSHGHAAGDRLEARPTFKPPARRAWRRLHLIGIYGFQIPPPLKNPS